MRHFIYSFNIKNDTKLGCWKVNQTAQIGRPVDNVS